MVKIKRSIKQQDLKIVDHNFVKSGSYSLTLLEVVDRASETPLKLNGD